MDLNPKEGQNKDSEEVKKLLNLLAHDLKSPIQNVVGFTNLLDELLKNELNPDIKFYINIIKQEAESTLNLLENFKDCCNNLHPKIEQDDLNKLRGVIENSNQERQKAIINT